jgi:hypothetical protein
LIFITVQVSLLTTLCVHLMNPLILCLHFEILLPLAGCPEDGDGNTDSSRCV